MGVNDSYTFEFDESQRQAILMALAHLAVERPGWDYMLGEIAKKMDRPETDKRRQVEALHHGQAQVPHVPAGKPILYERFKFYHSEKLKHDANHQILRPGQEDKAAAKTGAGS